MAQIDPNWGVDLGVDRVEIGCNRVENSTRSTRPWHYSMSVCLTPTQSIELDYSKYPETFFDPETFFLLPT